MPNEVEELELAAEKDDDEFEAAFNEAAESREFPPTDDPEETDGIVDELADDDPPADDETTGDADDKPAVDPYEGMTAEVKAKFVALEGDRDKLTHQVDSDRGRVTAFQRKVGALQGEIDTIREGSTTGADPVTSADIAAAMRGSDDDWDQFSSDYPEIARAIDKRLDSTGKATAEVIDRTLKPVTERHATQVADEVQTANQERVATVAETFPTWTEAVQTPTFDAWLADQTTGTRGLAGSDDPRDATELLGKYDAYLVGEGQPSLRVVTDDNLNEPDVDANQDDDPDGSELTEIERKRAQQLEDGAAPASQRAGIDADAEAGDEFERAFNAFAARKERKRA